MVGCEVIECRRLDGDRVELPIGMTLADDLTAFRKAVMQPALAQQSASEEGISFPA